MAPQARWRKSTQFRQIFLFKLDSTQEMHIPSHSHGKMSANTHTHVLSLEVKMVEILMDLNWKWGSENNSHNKKSESRAFPPPCQRSIKASRNERIPLAMGCYCKMIFFIPLKHLAHYCHPLKYNKWYHPYLPYAPHRPLHSSCTPASSFPCHPLCHCTILHPLYLLALLLPTVCPSPPPPLCSTV